MLGTQNLSNKGMCGWIHNFVVSSIQLIYLKYMAGRDNFYECNDFVCFQPDITKESLPVNGKCIAQIE